MGVRIESVRARPLSVPLVDPFVIASGRIDTTRAVLVEVTLCDERTGARATGIGEAAALPPVTAEDQPDILDTVRDWATRATGRVVDAENLTFEAWRLVAGDDALAERPVASAGIEVALLDAACRLRGCSMADALPYSASDAPRDFALVSDITVPILEPAYMAKLATSWRARGFTCFKVKVGIDLAHDLAALTAIRDAVGDATFRLDANGGYDARTAIALCEHAGRESLVVECFEQPCARHDLDGMRTVTHALDIPVVADESVHDLGDLHRVVEHGAADAINLKLVKNGGPSAAYGLGMRALEYGLSLMCGGMVETRLGMSAAAQLCVALGAVKYVDLDTAWLLRDDPFDGGYDADGPRYAVSRGPGHGVTYREARLARWVG